MKCTRCGKEAVIEMHHGFLCDKCFVHYFERKVLKTITQHKLIRENEKVGVAVSGGKDSITTLYLINKFMKRKRLGKPIALTVNEGIKGYREKTIKVIKDFAEENDIELKILNYKDYFGLGMDDVLKIRDKKKLNLHSCNVCGTFRRQILNRAAKELKLDVLATGHNMDDEAQTVLMNLFKGNIDIMPRQGITTNPSEEFVRRIKPLYFVSDKEVRVYSILKNFKVSFTECPYSKESYRNDVENFLNEFEEKYKGTKNAIVKTFLHFLPDIRKEQKQTIGKCKICGQPSKKEICKACTYLLQLKGE